MIKISQQYISALRRHLKLGPHANLQPASKLGRHAMSRELETLEMVRTHLQAIATLQPTGMTKSLVKRTEASLREALVPFAPNRRVSRQGKAASRRTDEVMAQRNAKMAAANLHLKRRVIRYKSAEAQLKRRSEECVKALKGALPQQKGLRKLTHKLFAVQEEDRRKISRLLENEVAQTLLSVNVHLLNLKTAAKGDKTSLVKEVAIAQRLVEDSIKSINRFACELNVHQPT